MSGDIEWRWADPNGQQRLVREDELRAALASGVIPPNAPVWKHGWTDWQPAYSVPELTTSALAAANGVVPNIPPPPLGVLGAQKDLEREGTRLVPGLTRPKHDTEPPVPPRYVPAATRISQPPAAMAPVSRPPPTASPSASKTVPQNVFDEPVLPPPSVPSVPTVVAAPPAHIIAEAMAAASAKPADAVPKPGPSQTLVEPPSSNKVGGAGSIADESNTGVRLGALDDAKAAQVLAANDARSKQALPTTVGVPALPQATLRAAAEAAAPPNKIASVPPPAPRAKTSKPPPPPGAGKKSKTLILYGGVPEALDRDSAADGPAPPINVPHPTGQQPQAITRPPPADGVARVSPAVPGAPAAPLPPPSIEELSSSILLEDLEKSQSSIVLSDSLNEVSAALPPKKAGGTLLGFPVPTAPASEVPSSPPREGAARPRSDAPVAGLPENKLLHDLRTLMKRPRPPWFWPVIGGAGVLASFGLTGLLVAAMRGGSSEETAVDPAASASAHVVSAPSASTMTAAATTASGAGAAPAIVGARCSVSGEGHTLAPRALVPTGIEVQATSGAIGMGFATGPKETMAIEVDPSSLTVGRTARGRAPDVVRRVVPDATADKLSALAETDAKSDSLAGRRLVPGPWPVDVGVAEGSIVWAPHGKDTYRKLWPLDGDGAVEALRGVPIEVKGQKGFAIAFRRAGAIWMAAALGDAELEAKGPLFRVMGLGPTVGSPTIASAGDGMLLAWADRASADDPWSLRFTRFTPGEAPHDATTFRLPAGGLGDNAMSPWLVSAGLGRILLTWTEGPVSGHHVRAQTLNREGAPIGDAFTISAEGINAGQAQSAVMPDGHGVVAFLAQKGKGYEVVAVPIACPVK